MRLQSRHTSGDRFLDLDSYMSPPCAVQSLIAIEGDRIPPRLWEPCAGDCTGMVLPLRSAGYHVETSDIADYGVTYSFDGDILTGECPINVQGVVTNPPFKPALRFVTAALRVVPYSAWLLRTNWLESVGRLPFFRQHPPARIWISSRRLPMMHRYGWNGPQASSNTCFAWFVWDAATTQKGVIGWFDWSEHITTAAAA
jgi:hypothetical protein